MIHPKTRDGINPARKNSHTPRENGGKNVASFSKDMRWLNKETSPHFEGFWEAFAEFVIWITLFRGDCWVDGPLAPAVYVNLSVLPPDLSSEKVTIYQFQLWFSQSRHPRLTGIQAQRLPRPKGRFLSDPPAINIPNSGHRQGPKRLGETCVLKAVGLDPRKSGF